MKTPMLSGLRGRALLLVMLTAIPVFALLLYQGRQSGVAAKRLALEHTDELRRFIATTFDDQTEETRQLLEILAQAEPGRCAALAADLNRHEKYYANIGATAPNGDVWCSALPQKGPVNLRDRVWFKTALATRSFTFGEVVIGRITRRPVLVMGLPAYDSAGELRAAYFASLDLVWFSEYTARAKLPPGSTVSVLDNEGKVLSRYPNAEKWVGAVRHNDFMRQMRAGLPVATFEQLGLDGVSRLYAAAPLTEAAQKSPIYLAVGIPLDKVYADLRQIRMRTLATLVAMVLVVLLVAWTASETVLLRPLQVLTAAARRLSQGDLHTRTGLVRQRDELGELARAFDEMANQLQVRNVEFGRALEELRTSNDLLHSIVEHAPVRVFWKDRESRYLGCNSAFARDAGLSRPEELLGKDDFQMGWRDQAELYRVDDMRVMESGVPKLGFEEPQTTPDGRTLWLRTSKVPLQDADGKVFGVLGIYEDITTRKQAEEALQKSNEMLERMFENTQFLIAYLDRDFNFIRVNKAYADAGKQLPSYFVGKNHFALYPNTEAEAIFRRVMETGEPYTVYARPFEYPDQPERGTTWWDWTLSPVRDPDGKVVALVFALVDVTERIRAEQRAGYLHLHDELTGLPNRVLLLDRLRQSLIESGRHKREVAVLCVDLDRFKYVNETLGHTGGDAMLKEAAVRLSACVRPGDTVARLAGDQFALILADMASVDDVGLIVQKIMNCGAKPLLYQEHEYFMSVSLGIALYPVDDNDAEQLLKCAELAMHQTKERGGNGWQFYSAQLANKASEMVMLSNELRQALDRGEFLLYYQPQVEIASERIVGAEALIRWKHSERGLIPPAMFIPLAEEIGLIGPLGEWVLRQACDQLRAWEAAGLPAIRVAVNVSAQQFRHNNLAHTVEQALHDCMLLPGSLEIEVTESVLMPGDEAPSIILRKIADLGVSVSIDDFGTGYSGLSYLKRFPINSIKVDQSFVRDIVTDNDDSSIVHAVIAMAHNLDIKTVAEGVETGAQLALLQTYGCDLAQGFYFSRPLPAEEFARLLREQHACCKGKDYVN